MNKTNIILLVVLLIIGAIVHFVISSKSALITPGTAENVYIRANGKLLKVLELNKSGLFYFKGKSKGLTVEILNSAVKVKSSGCPNKICVNTGFVRGAGSSIICAPNGIIVEIGKRKGLDAETR